jgi:hypothetical protein
MIAHSFETMSPIAQQMFAVRHAAKNTNICDNEAGFFALHDAIVTLSSHATIESVYEYTFAVDMCMFVRDLAQAFC